MFNNAKQSKTIQNLAAHKASYGSANLKDLFAKDAQRFEHFSLEAADLFLDYSKQRILHNTLPLLCALAEDADLATKRAAMFGGAVINITEQRAVLHTALRDISDQAVIVAGENVKPLIQDVMRRLGQCAQNVRDGRWLGFSNQPIKSIVNIGIGGSDLGPAMATCALTPHTARTIDYHFVSNIDATHIAEVLRRVDPATTLFIVASKTFTTQETLCNANTARDWLLQHANVDNAALAIKRHFIAVTAKPERAANFGIDQENIFPFWDWVGGRYSLWSAIGLPLIIALGMEKFKEFLAGANAMDRHFHTAPLAQNMPVLMALLGIWNINFWHDATHAVIPYDQYLHLLPSYLQQLDMESNGKQVRINGTKVDYATAPIIWGSVGTNGQHAFHQLLMQGTQTVPVDFIVAAKSYNNIGKHHELLVANCFAQSQALMRGRSADEVRAELAGAKENTALSLGAITLDQLVQHKIIPGNVPSNTIMMPQLTPAALGALLALYEHKVFVQGVIWDINSFDQWGVELGKQLANNIATVLANPHKNVSDTNGTSANSNSLDASTLGLMNRFNRLK
jgi:glucose-6-phosphate isomerase